MVKSVILMRHAEREDRAAEQKGIDWISTAPRPQDPLLSDEGRKQAKTVGEKLKEANITKILASPMIRCVLTADIIASELGLGENSVAVELGLVEEAKSFRGKALPEPRPNWNPLVLPIVELAGYSSKVDLSYESLHIVSHVKDEEMPNTVREVHPTLTDKNEVTKDRCKTVLTKILTSEILKDDVVLLVTHGASVKAMSAVLEQELNEDEKIAGERTVSCFAEFRPVDATNPLGPWKAVNKSWDTGDVHGVENVEDQGLA